MAENRKGNATLTWKGEVTFEGTIEEFSNFKAVIEKHATSISISGSDGRVLPNYHKAGFIPIIRKFLSEQQIAQLTEGAARMQFKAIEGIAGGIRSPHIHLEDEVVLVDKERFKTILGEVASSITQERVDSEVDYYQMVKSVMTD